MKVISICNQKGGAGKTTTAGALWAYLRGRGFRVLAIDMDGQHNLSFSSCAAGEGASILGVLLHEVGIKEAIQHTAAGDIIPGVDMLNNADTLLNRAGLAGSEYRLKGVLAELEGSYDYIIIDTPPHLGALILNALTASDYVLIPAQADIYNMQGISQLYETIGTVKQFCNPSLKVLGIVLTRYNARTKIAQDIRGTLEGTAARIGTRLFASAIRESTTVKEAQAAQQPLLDYAPKSKVSEDYVKLFNEIGAIINPVI